MRVALVFFLSSGFLGACTLRHIVANLCEGCDDASGEQQPWGDYSQSLPIADCAPGAGPVLTVTTAAEENDGTPGMTLASEAGVDLSFEEALVIATNRGEYTVVTFEPAVFPSAAPVDIQISRNILGLCIDARGSGVRLRSTNDNILSEMRIIGAELGGLMFVTSTLDGCLLGFDDAAAGGDVEIFSGTLSHSVVRNSIRLHSAGISDSFVGRDPRDSSVLYPKALVDCAPLSGDAISVTNSTLVRSEAGFVVEVFNPPSRSATVLLADNLFTGLGAGVRVADGPASIYDSRFREVPIPATVRGADAVVELRRNSVTGAQSYAVFEVGAPTLLSPTNLSLTPIGAGVFTLGGDCSQDGEVEVFLTRSNQAEHFVDTTPCTAATAWQWELDAQQLTEAYGPGPWNVTTTLTASSPPRTSSLSAPLSVIP